MEKYICSTYFDKRLLFGIYEEFQQISNVNYLKKILMSKISELAIHTKRNTNGEQILKRYSNSIAIKKMQIKTTVYLSALQKLESPTIKSIVNDTKQLELSYIVSEGIHWYNQFGNQFGTIW